MVKNTSLIYCLLMTQREGFIFAKKRPLQTFAYKGLIILKVSFLLF
jgi:hypothetical protein